MINDVKDFINATKQGYILMVVTLINYFILFYMLLYNFTDIIIVFNP